MLFILSSIALLLIPCSSFLRGLFCLAFLLLVRLPLIVEGIAIDTRLEVVCATNNVVDTKVLEQLVTGVLGVLLNLSVGFS